MSLRSLCPPALIYLVFSFTQIIIDTYNQQLNKALLKSGITVIFTLLLNYLCSLGLGVVSWIFVFIPFLLMGLIITILLYYFGLDPATGRAMIKYDDGYGPAPKKPIDHRAQVEKENIVKRAQEDMRKDDLHKKTHEDIAAHMSDASRHVTTHSSSKNTHAPAEHAAPAYFDNVNDSTVNTMVEIIKAKTS